MSAEAPAGAAAGPARARRGRTSSRPRARRSRSTATTAPPSATSRGGRRSTPRSSSTTSAPRRRCSAKRSSCRCSRGEVFARGIAAGREQLGTTIVRTFLEAWEPPENRVRLMAMLRSALTNEAAMGMIRDLLVREVFGPDHRGAGRARRAAPRDAGRLAVRRPRRHALRRAHRAAGVGVDRRAGRGDRSDAAAVPHGGPRSAAWSAGRGAAAEGRARRRRTPATAVR